MLRTNLRTIENGICENEIKNKQSEVDISLVTDLRGGSPGTQAWWSPFCPPLYPFLRHVGNAKKLDRAIQFCCKHQNLATVNLKLYHFAFQIYGFGETAKISSQKNKIESIRKKRSCNYLGFIHYFELDDRLSSDSRRQVRSSPYGDDVIKTAQRFVLLSRYYNMLDNFFVDNLR